LLNNYAEDLKKNKKGSVVKKLKNIECEECMSEEKRAKEQGK